jgi:hypothetical protein
MIGENADQCGSSKKSSMRSTSSSVSLPSPTSRVRRWSRDNRNQRAPGEPPSITQTRPQLENLDGAGIQEIFGSFEAGALVIGKQVTHARY